MAEHRKTRQEQVQTSAPALTYDMVRFLKGPLDIALTRLSQQDSRCAKVVEMFYFGGVNCEDVAKFLGVSIATVNRSLKLGKAWLKRELNSRPSSPRPVSS
jgi:DNA-directed RNA polymerase specialized sigma24 family protein